MAHGTASALQPYSSLVAAVHVVMDALVSRDQTITKILVSFGFISADVNISMSDIKWR